ncbi:cytochrome c3 family protein [Raoultibacter phocaeensis]|uniref:cytochrome c3 family protein n=1 Tax=Raoultibacter phocaeensis TaxID=2479841 RepID=UPI00111A2846|nr:cytochrome c3 family protein [Raoultibacter phocaeensis]
MRTSTLSMKAAMALALAALMSVIALAGCAAAPASNETDKGGGDATTQQTAADPTDPTGVYVSDEACLACHGGSYEAHAAETADYGQWNPHASIHGGYSSCDNCHEKGQELTKNWCANCHPYSAEGSSYYQEPLFL